MKINFPKHLKPLNFQIDTAVPFALTRAHSYLALEPGLGKTICAALVINTTKMKTLYICPPFLMGNVEAELTKWCNLNHLPLITRLGCKKTSRLKHELANIIICPDSLVIRKDIINSIQSLFNDSESLIIIDEAHRFKSYTAKRTKALFKVIFPLFKKSVFLSGTPMPNRPIELFTVLRSAAPETIDYRNLIEYGRYFCGAFEGKWGWDFSGATNVEELSERILNKFMIRIRKLDVLPDLPERLEEIVFLDGEANSEIQSLEKKILAQFSPKDLMKNEFASEYLATYRRLLGIAKIKRASEYIKSILDETNESILVFAIHKEVIAGLKTELKEYAPDVITGDIDKDKRFKIASEFQSNPSKRMLIMNIQAGGVGFNLTKATRVIFAEFAWTPADNSQAIDRAHRIGQDDRVLAQYLVYPNSIDRAVLDVCLSKMDVTKYF